MPTIIPRLIALSLLVAMLAAVLAACGGGSEPEEPTTSATAQPPATAAASTAATSTPAPAAPTPTPTVAPTTTPSTYPAPDALSLDEYLAQCAPPDIELADDATWGDFSTLITEEADRLEGLTPPSELSGIHAQQIAIYMTILDIVNTQAQGDVIDFTGFMLLASVTSDSEERMRETAAQLPDDVGQRMVDAGCIQSSGADLEVTTTDTTTSGSGTQSQPAAPDDHSNEIEGATPVQVGTAVTGIVDYEGDEDFFAFMAEEGVLYQIETGLESLPDAYLGIHSKDAFLVDGFNAISWEAPSSDEYYASVTWSGETGAYTLAIDALVDDHGDDASGATAIQVGQAIEGTIGYSGDMDFFHFTAEEGESFQIELTPGLPDICCWDVSVFDAEGVGWYGTSDAALDWEAPESGDYYVSVVAVYTTGAYSLTVVGHSAVVDDDHSNNVDGATTITVGEAVEGALNYEYDSDFFCFTAEEGQFYLVKVEPGPLTAYWVDWYDDQGLSLPGGDFWSAEYSGSHCIELSSNSGYTGSYTLTINKQ